MRQLTSAMNTYATSYEDRIASFTWQPRATLGGQPRYGGTEYADIRARMASIGPNEPHTTTAALQAVDIMRRRTGMTQTEMGMIGGWVPHVWYTHLILQDFLAARLPEKLVVSPADRHRLNWQRDAGRLYWQGYWLPFQPEQYQLNSATSYGGTLWRNVFSSSYQFVPASFDQLQSQGIRQAAGTTVSGRLYQNGDENVFFVSQFNRLGGLRMSDVSFPSQKTVMHDNEDRHFQKNEALFYAFPEAKVMVAMFDGSVGPRPTREANPGWYPIQPRSPLPTRFVYNLNGQQLWRAQRASQGSLFGYYRWTRGGLKGIDVGGREISSGQPIN